MNTRTVHLIISTIGFIIFYYISKVWLSNLYLFEWMADNWEIPLFIWIIVLILTLIKRTILAVSITIGHLIGIIVGQCLGDYLLKKSQALITPNMDFGQAHHLHNHKGFVIWLIILAASFIIGILTEVIYRKRGHTGNGG